MSTQSLAERILDEGPIGMAAAARLLGTFREGKPCHPSTVTRWIKTGVPLPNGTMLKLEAVQLAGRLVTSRAALVRFIEAQQSPVAEGPRVATRTPAARARASKNAAEQLEAMGA